MSRKQLRKLTPAQRRAEEALDQIAKSSSQPTKRVLDFLLAGSHDAKLPNPDQTQTEPRPVPDFVLSNILEPTREPALTVATQDDLLVQAKNTLGKQPGPRPDPDQIQTSGHYKSNSSDQEIAPSKDFNRRANSIDRVALPAGAFPGAGKKLYDCLYLRTRGAIKPSRTIQATRRELIAWSGVKNIKTINVHLGKLTERRLIKRVTSVGDQEGSIYEIFLPEEVDPDQTQTSTEPRPDPDRKTVLDQDQKMVWVGSGNHVDYKGVRSPLNTSFNTYADDDTHTLGNFVRRVVDGAKEVCGGEFKDSEEEEKRWEDLAAVLVEELKKAAEKTGVISSAPAFLAAHLRRSLAKNERGERTTTPTSHAPEVSTAKEKRSHSGEASSGGGTVSSQKAGAVAGSSFTFDERQRYAKNQRPPLGNGWMAQSASGKYDELVGEWLRRQAGDAPAGDVVNAVACPDCKGTGMWYPEGYEKGAAKCRHEKLKGKG